MALLASCRLMAQDGVGIGITIPDPSAIVHIQADARPKGLLIPRYTSADRKNIVSPAEGLVVYDTDVHSFYFFHRKWQRMGTPKGSIIMWSGSTPPPGWVLCDGKNYDVEGREATIPADIWARTPDLRGRFIVGYHSGNADYDQPGNRSTGGATAGETGGQTAVTLATSQIPAHAHGLTTDGDHAHDSAGSHSHPYRDGYFIENDSSRPDSRPGYGIEGVGTDVRGNDGTDWDNDAIWYKNRTTTSSGGHSHDSAGNHSHTVHNTGGGLAHENRPPYYTLAFIMKL